MDLPDPFDPDARDLHARDPFRDPFSADPFPVTDADDPFRADVDVSAGLLPPADADDPAADRDHDHVPTVPDRVPVPDLVPVPTDLDPSLALRGWPPTGETEQAPGRRQARTPVRALGLFLLIGGISVATVRLTGLDGGPASVGAFVLGGVLAAAGLAMARGRRLAAAHRHALRLPGAAPRLASSVPTSRQATGPYCRECGTRAFDDLQQFCGTCGRSLA